MDEITKEEILNILERYFLEEEDYELIVDDILDLIDSKKEIKTQEQIRNIH